jgi:hypothetical protein
VPGPTSSKRVACCEAQQASLDRKPGARLVMIATDAGMMAARRVVTQMLAAEQGSVELDAG